METMAEADFPQQVLTRATAVLESREKAEAWLNEPNPALGGRSPANLLGDTNGANEVLDLLTQIEHGLLH